MAPGALLKEGRMCQANGDWNVEPRLPSATIQPCKLPILDEYLELVPGRSSLKVSLNQYQRLRAFCEVHGTSEFNVLRVAWGLLLRCYTGNDTICFGYGTTTEYGGSSGKTNDRGITRLDLYTDTILATDTFVAMLARFAGPSRVLIERANEGGKELLQPPFDTFLLESGPKCKTRPHVNDGVDLALSQINMIVTLIYDSGGIMVEFNHLLSALSSVAAYNLAHTFEAILYTSIAQPHLLIGELNALSARDVQQLSRWNEKAMVRSEACVHHIIEENSRQTPRAPAISSWDGSLDYRELDDLSSRVANHLVSLGVGPEVIIPVCFEKSMWAVVAMLAVLKAGGAFVPLDPLHPVERLTTIIRKTRASLVVTSATHSALFQGGSVMICVVGRHLIDVLDNTHGTLPQKTVTHSGNAAFVLFTSGSTGQPKGIVQEHGSVCTNALAHGPALGMDSTSRVLQFAAFTFDVSMMDIFTTLILGGCICMPSEYDRMNDIVGFINSTHVNWTFMTPSFSNLIEPDDVPSLKKLALGGEAVTQENIQRWAGKVSLFNCYGPAEIGTCVVSATPIVPNARAETIGQRLSSTLCWLTDPSDHNILVPVGTIGELCVEGPTLAREYLNDSELTAAQFVQNPLWMGEVSGRQRTIYKVGDLLRQNSNGSFDFVGRIDSQVKIRGQRVELGEVEHQLSSNSAVAACVVACPKSGQYQKCLVGVVQPSACPGALVLSSNHQNDSELRVMLPHESNVSIAELARHMQERVPPYMVPNTWVLVERIPFSSSAKIDRKKVATWLMGLDRPLESSHTNGPRDSTCPSLFSRHEIVAFEISIKVANMIASGNESLRAKIAGHNVILSDIGLDSIQAISLAMFIRHKYDIRLGVEQLTHKDASIRDLAESIANLKNGVPKMTIRQFDIKEEWRLLSNQLKYRASRQHSKGYTVLLTGATGYLGVRILHDLLSISSIQKVVVHIRADSVYAGYTRIVAAASSAGRSIERLLPRLEIWLGDLKEPQLGLTSSQWDRVTGNTAMGEKIDAIIHNGASVRWNLDFETLKATNVSPTIELLNAMIDSRCPPKLVYVSGGQAIGPHNETDEQMLQNAALGNGYCQTKTVSELLVKSLMQDHRLESKLSIVKPSYIIGSPDTGIANTADFLWRLVGSCIDVNAYSARDQDGWLYLTDVDHVANSVVESCCDSATEGTTKKVLGGLPVQAFWNLLVDEFGYDIRPLDQDSWIESIRRDIDRKQEEHRLWPLLDTLEEGKGRIGVDGTHPEKEDAGDTLRVKSAIRKNVEYLIGIGFFPPPLTKGSHANGRMNGEIVGNGVHGRNETELF